jgi:regulator of protease activity HflC (stomatin/prohibitin superfamily)
VTNSKNPVSFNVVSIFLFALITGLGATVVVQSGAAPGWLLLPAAIAWTVAMSPRITQQWERAVVLRLGRFVGLRGPGLFWIVPFIDTVSRVIDQRVITTGFAA